MVQLKLGMEWKREEREEREGGMGNPPTCEAGSKIFFLPSINLVPILCMLLCAEPFDLGLFFSLSLLPMPV